MRSKVKQPCSQNTFSLCYIMKRGLLDCCNNAPRLRQNHRSAHVVTSKPSGVFLLRIMPLRLKTKTKQKNLVMTVCRRTPVCSCGLLPSDGWRGRSGWISPSQLWPDLRLAISPPTCGAHEYLWRRLIPDLRPGGVAALLNRKWTRSNAPIRLRCGETKHHHPTGRK